MGSRRLTELGRNAVPALSPLLLRWFLSYAPRYTRGHLNSVKVSGTGQFAGVGDEPIIVYLNHPSWWDPMIAAGLAQRYFPARAHYAPMDAAALLKYKFFARLGFFGVEQSSVSGARRFLEIGRQIAGLRNTVLWITAQGRFSDVRERPVKLAPGLAHLLKYCPDAIVFPLAIELTYGGERKPDALVRFGEFFNTARFTAHNEASILEQQLTSAMDELSAAAIKRNYSGFETILSGQAGVGGVYDLWRSVRARLKGSSFDPAHGSK